MSIWIHLVCSAPEERRLPISHGDFPSQEALHLPSLWPPRFSLWSCLRRGFLSTTFDLWSRRGICLFSWFISPWYKIWCCFFFFGEAGDIFIPRLNHFCMLECRCVAVWCSVQCVSMYICVHCVQNPRMMNFLTFFTDYEIKFSLTLRQLRSNRAIRLFGL